MKKIVLVGCGEAGSRYGEHLAGTGALAGVCDVDETKAVQAAQWNCPFHPSADAALGKADAMLLATPTGFHAEHAIKAFQSNMDVLVAAPLCLTVAAVWQIIETQKFCRRQLYIFSEHSLSPIELADDNETFFELEIFQSGTPLKDWQMQPFPGGTIFHNKAYSAIELLTESFGVVKSAAQHDGQLHVNLAKAAGLIRFSDASREKLDWELTVRANGRNHIVNSDTTPFFSGGSNEYASLLPPHLHWKTALQAADTLASVERLHKALNPVN
jgi:hypothetical protein